MPLLRAFPWETAASVRACRSASGRRAAAPALPAPLPTAACAREGQHASPRHRLPQRCPPRARPSLCTLQHGTQFKTRGGGLGKAGAARLFGLLVVKCCSMCPTLRHFTKPGKDHPHLVAGADVTQHVSAATSLPSAWLPVPSHPLEGCSRCSPFGDAALFPSTLLPAHPLGPSSGFPSSPSRSSSSPLTKAS